jgi:four helix bundle protein
MSAKSFRETTVYKKAFALAMEIFVISKSFPKEEKYSLTDQIRRASRSACTNLAEAYRKKIYKAHFVSKCTDSDAENSDTGVWLDFSLACEYIDSSVHSKLIAESEEIGKLLFHMINNPEKY